MEGLLWVWVRKVSLQPGLILETEGSVKMEFVYILEMAKKLLVGVILVENMGVGRP